jgi:hypothetical protein
MLSMKRIATVALACCVLLLGACGGDDDSGNGSQNTTAADAGNGSTLPQGSDPVNLDPADFTTEIDNPYWPMTPGNRWVSRSSEERIVVQVTDRRKTVAGGIEAAVVRDTVTDNNGDLVEVTDDWYAQDSDGNIWYLGEDVKDYKDGKVVSTGGSWEHGVDGALGGIAIPADPERGQAYRQEYYEGEAEDRAEVLSVSSRVIVPAGEFDDCLQTSDTTPLEPGTEERKYYAKGVGPVLNEKVAPDRFREELVRYSVK